MPDLRPLPWDDDLETPRPGGTGERPPRPLATAGASLENGPPVDPASLYAAGIDPDVDDTTDEDDDAGPARSTFHGDGRPSTRFGVGLSDGAGFDRPSDEWFVPVRPPGRPGTNGNHNGAGSPPIRPTVVWAARENPAEQTGPIRRDPIVPDARRSANSTADLPRSQSGRPLAPWEALASDGAPITAAGRAPGPVARDETPPEPTPGERDAPDPAAPAASGDPTGPDGPDGDVEAEAPARRSLIAADYRPDDDEVTPAGGVPVARDGEGVDTQSEQDRLWRFTRRIAALREEDARRAPRGAATPSLPGWAVGEPPLPPAPQAPVTSPTRQRIDRGLVVLGLLVLLAVGVFVLVVLRWPDRPSLEGPLTGADGAITRSLLADRTLSVATWVENLATVLVIGGVSFRLYVSRPPLTGRGASERLLFAASLAGIVACIVSLPLRALVVSGDGIGALGDPEVLTLVFTSRFGDAACVRILALVLFALIVARPPKGWGRRVFVVGSQGSLVGFWSVSRVTLERVACAVAGLVALASFTFVGHPQASEPRGFLLATQSLHILAASVWFGGGVLLALEVNRQRRSGTARTTAETVERFSTLAGVSVALVMISGIVLAHSQLASLTALWTTPYGRALVAKMFFVGLVAAVGGYNHSVLVPAIAKEDEPAAWRMLGRTTAIEGALIAAGVLVMTAAMTSGGI